jgi:ornithine cyclodeaminase
VRDLAADSAAGFRGYLEGLGTTGRVTVDNSAEKLIRSSDLVVFATVAAQPHVRDVSWFAHNPLVLQVSLRDLAPEILLASRNVVDDIGHCLKANTSPHLAEQLTGNRDFLLGTLDDVMAARLRVPADRPLVFSPFGLGVLDLAVGKYVYDTVDSSGDLHVIDEFFHFTGRIPRIDERKQFILFAFEPAKFFGLSHRVSRGGVSVGLLRQIGDMTCPFYFT